MTPDTAQKSIASDLPGLEATLEDDDGAHPRIPKRKDEFRTRTNADNGFRPDSDVTVCQCFCGLQRKHPHKRELVDLVFDPQPISSVSIRALEGHLMSDKIEEMMSDSRLDAREPNLDSEFFTLMASILPPELERHSLRPAVKELLKNECDERVGDYDLRVSKQARVPQLLFIETMEDYAVKKAICVNECQAMVLGTPPLIRMCSHHIGLAKFKPFYGFDEWNNERRMSFLSAEPIYQHEMMRNLIPFSARTMKTCVPSTASIRLTSLEAIVGACDEA